MKLVPITLREAQRFIAEHHRHSQDPTGWKFGVGLMVDGDLVAVGVAGRPTGRGLDNGMFIEITRVCTLGTRNACSRLYGALCRASTALGYERAYTYTLASEAGSSPAAAGFVLDAELPARGYGGGRARYETNLFGEAIRPEEAKIRWRRDLCRSLTHRNLEDP